MAVIFRFSGYLVDIGESYSEEDIAVEIKNVLDDGIVHQLHAERSDNFEWDDDLPVNRHNCDMAHLEAYFDTDCMVDVSRDVIVGGKYRHFKEGKIVEVLAISRNTEHINDVSVVYRCSDGRVWNRPYNMFVSKVDAEKYPEHKGKYRFELVKE